MSAQRPPAAARRRAWRPSTRVRVVSDVAVFAFFLALSAPVTTGLAVHEWLVVPFVPVFLGHVVTSWPWVTAMVRRGARTRGRPRANRALDAAMFVPLIAAHLVLHWPWVRRHVLRPRGSAQRPTAAGVSV